jgi:NhaP-type Na+/H+ or K+/H+ antiporter
MLDGFLGLIALVYGISLALHAWGFLAVFAACVALRQTELMLAQAACVKPKTLAEDETIARVTTGHENEHPPIVSVEALMFKEHLECLSELLLVLLLGGMLMVKFLNWRAVGLALFVFFITRPVSVFIGLAGTGTNWRIRSMVSWFGVRGIGSIYYLMVTIQRGAQQALARDLIQLTLTTVALSILVHGISIKPLMHRFWRAPDKSL